MNIKFTKVDCSNGDINTLRDLLPSYDYSIERDGGTEIATILELPIDAQEDLTEDEQTAIDDFDALEANRIVSYE